jgi:hypothetical protein
MIQGNGKCTCTRKLDVTQNRNASSISYKIERKEYHKAAVILICGTASFSKGFMKGNPSSVNHQGFQNNKYYQAITEIPDGFIFGY